jgi:hypothetical protein
MKLTFLPAPLSALLLAVAALPGCAQTPPAPKSASTPASAPARVAEPESARLAREMQALIGTAACSSDAQCRTLPVGAKACGGPAGYWAWSSVGTDEARLRELARKQADVHKREIEASGMLSNCRVVTDPGAACVAGRCQLPTPPSRGAP